MDNSLRIRISRLELKNYKMVSENGCKLILDRFLSILRSGQLLE